MTSVVHILSWLTPSVASGVAIVCCVAGVLTGQLAANGRREASERGPAPSDPAFMQGHARAAAARWRALADAAQFASSVLLVTAAFVALEAIVPSLVTQGIGALALGNCLYQLIDAAASYFADLRAIREDEMFDDFATRAPEAGAVAQWQTFAHLHPKAAKRLLRRRPGAAGELTSS